MNNEKRYGENEVYFRPSHMENAKTLFRKYHKARGEDRDTVITEIMGAWFSDLVEHPRYFVEAAFQDFEQFGNQDRICDLRSILFFLSDPDTFGDDHLIVESIYDAVWYAAHKDHDLAGILVDLVPYFKHKNITDLDKATLLGKFLNNTDSDTKSIAARCLEDLNGEYDIYIKPREERELLPLVSSLEMRLGASHNLIDLQKDNFGRLHRAAAIFLDSSQGDPNTKEYRGLLAAATATAFLQHQDCPPCKECKGEGIIWISLKNDRYGWCGVCQGTGLKSAMNENWLDHGSFKIDSFSGLMEETIRGIGLRWREPRKNEEGGVSSLSWSCGGKRCLTVHIDDDDFAWLIKTDMGVEVPQERILSIYDFVKHWEWLNA